MSKPIEKRKPPSPAATGDYSGLLVGVSELLEAARRASARTVNAFMTATYWEVGRRIVEHEQGGQRRAEYGRELIERLSADLTRRFGRGFGQRNVECMRQFFLAFPTSSIQARLSQFKIPQTLSAESGGRPSNSQTVSADSPAEICQTPCGESADANPLTPSSIFQTPSGRSTQPPLALSDLARAFPLPWSHYVLLISRSRSPEAFAFYHTEALRGGWSVRQLQRQMDSQFYERTALSRNKAAMLATGAKPQPGDAISADEEIRHPLVLEFLGLRDEYSETDLEDALIRHLEAFLLELGNDFAFVGRQRRLRIDDEWYRVDLLFFHRRLRCVVIFDLKLGRFTHADAGQMHLYLNYAREHWVQPGENPPVGVILCSGKSEALVRYATDALPNKLLVREYLTALPDEKLLAAELERTRKQLEARKPDDAGEADALTEAPVSYRVKRTATKTA
jgi:predicted nuclease of restriction endonuclease-like (RecB) superfamily